MVITRGQSHAIVLATTATSQGGVWRHIEDLSLELSNRGHTCVIGLRPEALDLRRVAAARGLRVASFARAVQLRGWTWHGHLHDTFDWRFAAVASWRRMIGPTVLTEHLPRTNASDESLRPGRRHPLARQAKTAFKRSQATAADRVIAVSPSSADFMVRRYGLRRESIDVVMNGIEPPGTGASVSSRRDDVRVVSVGSVIYQKGHELLVDAASNSAGRWRATVIGDGPLRAPLAERALRANAPVAFIGWSSAVADHLLEADIACLPSRWESCPYAALEAMGSGLPLIGADVDGVRDLIEHGVTGLLVPPDDAVALASALDDLAADPDRRGEMGRAARARAATHTIGRMADETVAVYERARERRTRRRRAYGPSSVE